MAAPAATATCDVAPYVDALHAILRVFHANELNYWWCLLWPPAAITVATTQLWRSTLAGLTSFVAFVGWFRCPGGRRYSVAAVARRRSLCRVVVRRPESNYRNSDPADLERRTKP